MLHFFFVGGPTFFLAFSKALESFPPPAPPPPAPPPLEVSEALEVALATPALDDRLEGDSELPRSLPPFRLEDILRPLGVDDDPFEGLFSGELR